MAITFDNLGTSAPAATPDLENNTDLASYSNTSWTPPTSGLIICFVFNERASVSLATIPTMSGNGITWVQIATQEFLSGAHHRITLFGADASGSSAGATTVDFGGVTQIGCIASFFHAAGVDLSGGVAAAFVQAPTNLGAAGTTSTVTLAPDGNAANRPIYGSAHTSTDVQSPRVNWTQADFFDISTPTNCLLTQYRGDAFETTATSTWATPNDWGCIGAELKADLGGAPPEILLRPTMSPMRW